MFHASSGRNGIYRHPAYKKKKKKKPEYSQPNTCVIHVCIDQGDKIRQCDVKPLLHGRRLTSSLALQDLLAEIRMDDGMASTGRFADSDFMII